MRLFAPPAARKGRVVNTEYQYTDEDIQAIFQARVRDFPNVRVLAAANMSVAAPGNRVRDVLSNYIDNYGCDATVLVEARSLIIPILIHHNHWVGIRLVLQAGQNPQIIYYNSLKIQQEDDQLKAEVLMEVYRVLNERSTFRNPMIISCNHCLQQSDGTSCGPYLIENIYCDITGRRWNPEVMGNVSETIRNRHLRLLQESRSDFYPGFNERQGADAPLALRMGLRAGGP